MIVTGKIIVSNDESSPNLKIDYKMAQVNKLTRMRAPEVYLKELSKVQISSDIVTFFSTQQTGRTLVVDTGVDNIKTNILVETSKVNVDNDFSFAKGDSIVAVYDEEPLNTTVMPTRNGIYTVNKDSSFLVFKFDESVKEIRI